MKHPNITIIMWLLYKASKMLPPLVAFLLVANQSMDVGGKCLLWVAVTLLVRIGTWACFNVADIIIQRVEDALDGGESRE